MRRPLYAFWILMSITFIMPAMAQRQAMDYARPENWIQFANIPQSERVITEVEPNEETKNVSIFFVAPTVLTDPRDVRWNAEMSDQNWKEEMKIPIQFQASAWQSCGQIYAPYYRQAHLRAYDSLEGKGKDALLFAYQDVRAAFIYFLESISPGRPFILAGHSQGSTQLVLLMKEFLDGTPLQKRLIAAYLPGIGIDSLEFQHIPFMSSPSQCNGYVTWNTMNQKADTLSYPLWYRGKRCINPVSWDLCEHTRRKEHRGFYYTNGKIYPHVFETELISGAVCVKNFRQPFKYAVKKYESLHFGDINLFWKDIEINSQLRVKAYFDALGTF